MTRIRNDTGVKTTYRPPGSLRLTGRSTPQRRVSRYVPSGVDVRDLTSLVRTIHAYIHYSIAVLPIITGRLVLV